MVESFKSSEQDRELGLVELAAILVRRRVAFILAFALVAGLGAGYALTAKESYKYTSIVQLVELDGETYLQSPGTVIALLIDRELLAVENSYADDHGASLPISVDFSNPGETGLIKLTTETHPSNEVITQEVHQELIKRLKQRQEQRSAEIRSGLEERLSAVVNTIESLRSTREGGTALAGMFEVKAELEERIQSFKSFDVISIARKSVRPVAPARLLIIAVSIVAAVLVGLFSALFSEFVYRVSLRLKETDG